MVTFSKHRVGITHTRARSISNHSTILGHSAAQNERTWSLSPAEQVCNIPARLAISDEFVFERVWNISSIFLRERYYDEMYHHGRRWRETGPHYGTGNVSRSHAERRVILAFVRGPQSEYKKHMLSSRKALPAITSTSHINLPLQIDTINFSLNCSTLLLPPRCISLWPSWLQQLLFLLWPLPHQSLPTAPLTFTSSATKQLPMLTKPSRMLWQLPMLKSLLLWTLFGLIRFVSGRTFVCVVLIACRDPMPLSMQEAFLPNGLLWTLSDQRTIRYKSSHCYLQNGCLRLLLLNFTSW